MSDAGETVPGRRLRRLLELETPLENDDLLSECLIRLPPLPSSLPRASLVCKRWRRLVSDPNFLRRFGGHHGKPPFLGYFSFDYEDCKIVFTSALDPPDRFPDERFFLRFDHDYIGILACRHGRVLFVDFKRDYNLVVWNPVSGHQCRVAICPDFGTDRVASATVICAAGDNGHVHGACHSSPFQVIKVGSSGEGVCAFVYSSETGTWSNLISGTWGNLISELWPNTIPPTDSGHYFGFSSPGSLIGNCIYWLLIGSEMNDSKKAAVLEFNLGTQMLTVMRTPPGEYEDSCQFLVTRADDGGLGFVILSGFSAKLWKWNANRDGVAEWLFVKTIELNDLLSLRLGLDMPLLYIIGFSEDDNAMFLRTFGGVFMVYLESLQFKKVPDIEIVEDNIFPFASFYPAGYIAQATHNVGTSKPAGSIERTMIRSERATSGIGHAKNASLQIQVTAERVEEGSRSPFGEHASEGDTDHIVLSNAQNDVEKLTPHMSELEAGIHVEGVQGAHCERSRKHVESGNLGKSIIPPSQGAKEIKSIVVETIEAYMECKQQQYIPHQEFSVAKCITAMREMVDVSDDEKVLACDLFRDGVNREIFLSLDVTLRTMWLKKQLTKFC